MDENAHSRDWTSLLSAVLIGRKPKFTLIRIVVLVTVIFLTRQFARSAM